MSEPDLYLSQIFTNFKTVILSTVSSKGTPEASYAPSVLDDKKNFYVYVSSLAKHTANLTFSKRASLMIIEDEQQTENLHARKRLTLNCSICPIQRESEQFEEIQKIFVEKFGETSALLKNLLDFKLFCLTPIDGRLVTGFGSTFRLTGTKIDTLKPVNGPGHIQASTNEKD